MRLPEVAADQVRERRHRIGAVGAVDLRAKSDAAVQPAGKPVVLTLATGDEPFAQEFAAKGPRDSKGRSLRELDLTRRLLRYPCSYMIYTAAFDALPAEAREVIYRRMWQVLSGEEQGQKYAALSLGERQAIVEILRDTKQGLPQYFQTVVQ